MYFVASRRDPTCSPSSLTASAHAGSARGQIGGIASGSPLREIARRLDRAASTVSREISRHSGRPAYRAHVADDHAWDSALRPKKCLLAVNRKLPAIEDAVRVCPQKLEIPSGNRLLAVLDETLWPSVFAKAVCSECRGTPCWRARFWGSTRSWRQSTTGFGPDTNIG